MSSTARILGIIATAVLAGGLAACGMPSTSAHPAAAAPAGAAEVPVRVQPNAVGWSGMVQRPDRIYVGMGGAPIARQLTWRNWGGPRAWAAGKLDIYWPQPGPISGWHPTTYTVTVRLQDIQTHNGQPSYRELADFYVNRHGAAKALYFKFHVLPGGSVPAWNPAALGKPGFDNDLELLASFGTRGRVLAGQAAHNTDSATYVPQRGMSECSPGCRSAGFRGSNGHAGAITCCAAPGS